MSCQYYKSVHWCRKRYNYFRLLPYMYQHISDTKCIPHIVCINFYLIDCYWFWMKKTYRFLILPFNFRNQCTYFFHSINCFTMCEMNKKGGRQDNWNHHLFERKYRSILLNYNVMLCFYLPIKLKRNRQENRLAAT